MVLEWARDCQRMGGVKVAERVVVGDAYGSPYAPDITDGTLLEKRQVVRWSP